MTINFHPNPGTILKCDFFGFEAPEMIKTRPIIVVSPRARHGANICTIVPLSTTEPKIVQKWHYKLSLTEPISPNWPELTVWVKCNMIYTLNNERFDRFHKKIGDKRNYYVKKIPDKDLSNIRCCIKEFLDC